MAELQGVIEPSRQVIAEVHSLAADAAEHLAGAANGTDSFDWHELIPSTIQFLTVISGAVPNPISRYAIAAVIAILKSFDALSDPQSALVTPPKS